MAPSVHSIPEDFYLYFNSKLDTLSFAEKADLFRFYLFSKNNRDLCWIDTDEYLKKPITK